jgi:general secretion pathway protein D
VSFGNNGVTAGSTSVTPASSATTTLPSGRTVTTTTPARENTILSTISGTVKPITGGLNANTARGFAPAVGFLSADGASAVLSFLNKDADTEVVATPRAVTLDNETAILSVTRAYPIFQITPGSANSPAGAQTMYTNLGTILTVTPRISGDNNIALRVVPEVSNIDSKDQQTVNGQINQANIYAIRKIETHVMIPSGNTLVMGGLISDSKTKSYVKVPILGDLPGIGLIFRQDSKKRIKQNLLIFITPTIIQDDDYNVIKNDFLKVKEGDRDRLLKSEVPSQESPWNSGKPHDWGKPVKQED